MVILILGRTCTVVCVGICGLQLLFLGCSKCILKLVIFIAADNNGMLVSQFSEGVARISCKFRLVVCSLDGDLQIAIALQHAVRDLEIEINLNGLPFGHVVDKRAALVEVKLPIPGSGISSFLKG